MDLWLLDVLVAIPNRDRYLLHSLLRVHTNARYLDLHLLLFEQEGVGQVRRFVWKVHSNLQAMGGIHHHQVHQPIFLSLQVFFILFKFDVFIINYVRRLTEHWMNSISQQQHLLLLQPDFNIRWQDVMHNIHVAGCK